MGVIYLKWDDTLISNINTIAQRASKRIKTVGLPWLTTGFTPANDLSPSIFQTQTNVTDNKVYEFKIENICNTGGPTIGSNGIREQISFACIVPSLGSDNTTITVTVNLASTDITKARLVLRRQSDNLLVGGPLIANNVADAATHTFTGLTPNTGYYVTVELYATIQGIEVISSDPAYLGFVCGGNTSGYQINTTSICRSIQVTAVGGPANITYTSCDGQVITTPTDSAREFCTDGSGITVNSGSITTVDLGSC